MLARLVSSALRVFARAVAVPLGEIEDQLWKARTIRQTDGPASVTSAVSELMGPTRLR